MLLKKRLKEKETEKRKSCSACICISKCLWAFYDVDLRNVKGFFCNTLKFMGNMITVIFRNNNTSCTLLHLLSIH